jgi:hypothetical protein
MNQSFDKNAAISVLNRILERELAGVVRYTHYALMVYGYNRLPIVGWLNAQADESLLHARQGGNRSPVWAAIRRSASVRCWKPTSTISATSCVNPWLTRKRRSRRITNCWIACAIRTCVWRNMPAL